MSKLSRQMVSLYFCRYHEILCIFKPIPSLAGYYLLAAEAATV
ncbi:hypothetical protein JOC77_003432 [Peribacillus deserti]|uniref:Uncharacterized protein n=1 Tax=Peribacillus deserti TaxID=673318 RepID=A0ABS2QLE5_9BACI|nr:hypothetical protein [Peribacillus deserti]MBM7693988.1 hypothetical protein [Peribacillus deserti]